MAMKSVEMVPAAAAMVVLTATAADTRFMPGTPSTGLVM